MRTIRDEDNNKGVAFEGVHVLRHTGKAMLCVIEGEELWVPHSQVDDESEVYWEKGVIHNSGEKLVVTQWWAKKAGLLG